MRCTFDDLLFSSMIQRRCCPMVVGLEITATGWRRSSLCLPVDSDYWAISQWEGLLNEPYRRFWGRNHKDALFHLRCVNSNLSLLIWYWVTSRSIFDYFWLFRSSKASARFLAYCYLHMFWQRCGALVFEHIGAGPELGKFCWAQTWADLRE